MLEISMQMEMIYSTTTVPGLILLLEQAVEEVRNLLMPGAICTQQTPLALKTW